ncbi:MAG: glycosyltransferase [Smithellaceae bacterium]
MNMQIIRKYLPKQFNRWLSETHQRFRSANILQSTGKINPYGSEISTFVLAVGPTFDQNCPIAMTVARLGYCHAFDEIGIPYIISDIRNLVKIIKLLFNPFIMYVAEDIPYLPEGDIKKLRLHRSAVWVPPWFNQSDTFYSSNGLDAAMWFLSKKTKQKIMALEPRFCFTATVPSGLHFFENWVKNGIPVVSLPLACDTHLYNKKANFKYCYNNVKLAFVGGYWESKGKQIDLYLRSFENDLTIYGYNKWPYKGYVGVLPQDGSEASLYKQARLCPVINEPTVALLKGQINERVFKVLGSGGCPVVDAVPSYRELYNQDELIISENADHFKCLVKELLQDEDLNNQMRQKGYIATIEKHTYKHRAIEFITKLDN